MNRTTQVPQVTCAEVCARRVERHGLSAPSQDVELTVDELTEAVVAHAGPWAGALVMPAFNTMWPRWRMAIGTAANRGVLCFGPNRDRNITYTNPRRWLPEYRPVEQHIALAE